MFGVQKWCPARAAVEHLSLLEVGSVNWWGQAGNSVCLSSVVYVVPVAERFIMSLRIASCHTSGTNPHASKRWWRSRNHRLPLLQMMRPCDGGGNGFASKAPTCLVPCWPSLIAFIQTLQKRRPSLCSLHTNDSDNL